MTEKKSVFLFLSLSQILEESHHTYMKKRTVFPWVLSPDPVPWENTMGVKDILLGKVSLLSGVFDC